MQITSTIFPLMAALIFTGSSFAANNIIVKIGHAAPLSGPNGHIGKDNENGAKMAIEELNSKGIMIGGRRAIFKLITEDDGGDPKQAAIVAGKLVNAKVDGVIGHLNSHASISAAKTYHAAGIPQISPSSTSMAYTSMGYGTTFRVVAGDDQLGRILGRYAVQTLKANTIAVIDDRSTYGQGVADEFIKGAKAEAKIKKVRINIVRPHLSDGKITNFGAVLATVKEAKPDVIFFGGMDYTAGALLRQIKALDIKVKFMGGDGICTTALPKLAGNAIDEIQVTCAEAGGVVDTQKISSFLRLINRGLALVSSPTHRTHMIL